MASDAAEPAAGGQLFPSLDPDDPELSVTEIESLCMNCHEQGVTKLLLTKIPYFKDVVISSFECASCGFESRSTDLAGRIQDEGVQFELKVAHRRDLNRQMVRARGSEIRVPQLDSAFPCSESSVTTLEGAFAEIADNLRSTIEALEVRGDTESVGSLRQFVDKLAALCQADEPAFTVVLHDPSGNSFLENPHAPKTDPNLKVERFARSKEQDRALGIGVGDDEDEEHEEYEEREAGEQAVKAEQRPEKKEEADSEFDRYAEVVAFQVNCPNCNAPTETRTKMVQVPYFKEVVIMATNCEQCGHKDSSVQGGGGIEPLGVRLELRVLEDYDLCRDVLVSNTCSVGIPELEFSTEEGSLGGKFTTVEGLLVAIGESLASANPCLLGDAANSPRFAEFLTSLGSLTQPDGRRDYRLVLDDPAGNSYIQNVCAPDPDPQLLRHEYERTPEQNDLLGISDMRTENYAE